MARPTIRTGPASQYAGPKEIIREFSDGKSGGLMSLRRQQDGPLVVEVYQVDDDVEVRAKRTPPKIEVLIVRDPDGGTNLTIWVDGVESNDYVEQVIDPGYGHQRSDWNEGTESIRNDESLSAGFRETVVAEREAWADNKYIEDDEGTVDVDYCKNCVGYADDPRVKPHGKGWRHVVNNSSRCPGQEDDETDDRVIHAHGPVRKTWED